MAAELSDEELRRARAILLIDPRRPEWGAVLPIPGCAFTDGMPREPVQVEVDSKDPDAVDRWTRRITAMKPHQGHDE